MSDDGKSDQINPTVRWLVHGAWKIALTVVVILLIGGIVNAIVR
jgi:hypothetical protein